jgi:hypothetical protein
MHLTAHALCMMVFVLGPFALIGFAFLWWELCKAMFIGGMLLSPVSLLCGWAFSLYCKPVFWLFPNLHTSHAAFGGSLHAHALPADAYGWCAMLLFYSAISVTVASLVSGWLRRRRA